jgi:hypothetical protein
MKHNTKIIHGVDKAIALAGRLEAETGAIYEVVNFWMLLEGHRLYQDRGEEEVIEYLDRGRHKEETCLVMDEPSFWMLNTLLMRAFKARGVLH